jgi:hypothetical protein
VNRSDTEPSFSSRTKATFLGWLLCFACWLFVALGNAFGTFTDPGKVIARDGVRNIYADQLFTPEPAAGLFCGNDPVNRHDPLGLEVFFNQDEDGNWTTSYFPPGYFDGASPWAVQPFRGTPQIDGKTLGRFNFMNHPIFYDSFDYAFLKSLSQGTDMYRFGTMSSPMIFEGYNRGYVDFQDLPLIYRDGPDGCFIGVDVTQAELDLLLTGCGLGFGKMFSTGASSLARASAPAWEVLPAVRGGLVRAPVRPPIIIDVVPNGNGVLVPQFGALPQPAPILDLLPGSRVTTPNAAMRGFANLRGTYVDPLTGTSTPASGTLAADHFVPKSWIKLQPGFSDLTREQQSWLLNHPINTQGIPTTFNSSKGAKMPGNWQTYKGQPLDPNYIQNDAQRAQFTQMFILRMIEGMRAGRQ